MLLYTAALQAVREMLAAECGCAPEDFLADGVRVVEQPAPNRSPLVRQYPAREPSFLAISMGSGAVVAAQRSILADVERVFRNAQRDGVFMPAQLLAVHALLAPHDLTVYGPYPRLLAAEDTLRPRPAPDGFRLVIEEQPSVERLTALGPDRWPNAISLRREKGQRVLAMLEHDGEIVGVAMIGSDTPRFWQIGIDVAPEHRGRGLAPVLTAALGRYALDAGGFPFYGVAPANLASISTALSAGFRLAWVEVFTSPKGRWGTSDR